MNIQLRQEADENSNKYWKIYNSILRHYLLEINLFLNDWLLCDKVIFQADESTSYLVYKWKGHTTVEWGNWCGNLSSLIIYRLQKVQFTKRGSKNASLANYARRFQAGGV